MSTRPLGDEARVSVLVAVEPNVAFQVFTEEIDRWWRRGPKYRVGGSSPGVLQFEPGVGGRLFESIEAPSGPVVHEVGRITVWDPPSRLGFEWRGKNFAPYETTEVAVRFEPTASGTRVTVEHRGWAAFPPDAPVRHGLQGAEFLRTIGLWWGELASSMREYVATRSE